MKFRYRDVVAYAVPLIVALSLSVVLAKQARQIALSNEDNAKAFHSFSAGLEEYQGLRPEWRTRFLSTCLPDGLSISSKLASLRRIVTLLWAASRPNGQQAGSCLSS